MFVDLKIVYIIARWRGVYLYIFMIITRLEWMLYVVSRIKIVEISKNLNEFLFQNYWLIEILGNISRIYHFEFSM